MCSPQVWFQTFPALQKKTPYPPVTAPPSCPSTCLHGCFMSSGAAPTNGWEEWQDCCRKGDPFQGLKLGSCLTLGNELSEETRVLTKQEILLERASGGEQEGKETQENSSVTWLAVSGFMVIGLVSRLSLASHTDSSSSWWCTPCSAKMDAREKDSGRWSDMWCLLLTFPELFRLVMAY